jgi:hypothetical protein
VPVTSGYFGWLVAYGFRVLPAGYRNYDGSNFYNRGNNAFFWSSSAYSATNAWNRYFNYNNATVNRNNNNNRSYGFSVRCIRDSTSKAAGINVFFKNFHVIQKRLQFQ